MKRSTGLLILAATSGMSLIAYFYIARWLGAPDPWFSAWALLAAVLVHELFHVLAFERFGVKAHMVVLVVIGGAFPDPHYSSAAKRLTAHQNATVLLAGVCGNLLLILLSVPMEWLGILSETAVMQIASLNGGLILWNLLPFGPLDGGRFAKLLFDSIPESQDASYVKMISIVVIGGLLAIMIVGNDSLVLPAALLIYGLNKKSKEDDSSGSRKQGALRVRERFVWIAIYAVLILIGAAFSLSKPDFINKQRPLAAVF